MSFNPQNPVESWIIGRATDCDLVVAEPTVSGRHCRLTREGSQYRVEDLHSPNGIYVNGTRVPAGQTVPILQGAQITLGRHVPMPWPPAPVIHAAAPPVERVATVLATDTKEALRGRVITIGRAPESNKQIDLPIVSWNHARIVFENGRAVLEDLKSRNGTAIDRMDNRIQRAVLEPGSDVYLGSYKISASELLTPTKVSIGESAFDKVRSEEHTSELQSP